MKPLILAKQVGELCYQDQMKKMKDAVMKYSLL